MTGSIRISRLEASRVSRYKTVLCDLDGCLIAGKEVLPGAKTFLDSLRDRIWIVSNNSSDTAATLSARLESMGLPVPMDRILLAGELAVRRAGEHKPGSALMCLADPPLKHLAVDLGLELVSEKADLVLLGRMAAFDLDTLEKAVAALCQGAEFWVANTDCSHPTTSGLPVPETGAWLAALRACLPDVRYESFGKPGPDLLAEALQRSGSTPPQTIFVGDNPVTDGVAAARLGIDFVEINRFSNDSAPRAQGAVAASKAGGGASC